VTPHAAQRLKQRYGVPATVADLDELARRALGYVAAGDRRVLLTDRKDVVWVLVEWRGRRLPCVCRKADGYVITVLPRAELRRWPDDLTGGD
jgi:hypothetical protein